MIPGRSVIGRDPVGAATSGSAAPPPAQGVEARHSTVWAILATPAVEAVHRVSYGQAIPIEVSHRTRYALAVPIEVRHRAVYAQAVPIEVSHRTRYALAVPIEVRHRAVYAQAVPIEVSHRTCYALAVPIEVRHRAVYAQAVPIESGHRVCYAQATPIEVRHRARYAMRATIEICHRGTWSLLERTPVETSHRAIWSSPDISIQILSGPNHLEHQGRRVPIGDGTSISLDEGSPVWLANLDLIYAEDYARIAIGDALTLYFWGSPVALMCDGRRRSRADVGLPTYTISAISPVAALGSPWAVPITLGPVGMARATAERLLGQPIDWRLPDWRLPDTAAALEATPLDLARQIAAAPGGVIESRRDGSLIARPLDPVSPPDYARIAPAARFTDRDLLDHSDSAGAVDLDNRYLITSGDLEATSSQIQIEQEQDTDDPHAYSVRAWLWPWRPVDLVHTGDSATRVSARAEAQVEHDELLEVRAGFAQTTYPVTMRLRTAYQYADLGRIDISGREITTAIADYSQLRIAYRSRCWEWRVTNARTETIQFLAVE